MSLPSAYSILMGKPGEPVTEGQWSEATERMGYLLRHFRRRLDFQPIKQQEIRIFDQRTTSTVSLQNFPNAITDSYWTEVGQRVLLSPTSMARIVSLGRYEEESEPRWAYRYYCWGLTDQGEWLFIRFDVITFDISGKKGYLREAEVRESTVPEIVAELEINPREIYDFLEKTLRGAYDRSQAALDELKEGLRIFHHQNLLVRVRDHQTEE